MTQTAHFPGPEETTTQSGWRTRAFWSLAIALFLTGCGEGIYDEIELMPAPTVYSQAGVNPFPDNEPTELVAQSKLFYVTDRALVGEEDGNEFYANRRGQLARAGIANVVLKPGVQDWDEFVEITLSGTRDREYLLTIDSVDEFGVLPFSVAALYPDPPERSEMDQAGRDFAAAINQQLSLTRNKDVHIFVHGYNVDFDYSTLVARELEHFLGYQGVFLAYNWAATPNSFAYFRDQESAMATRRNLRSLIEFIQNETDVEKVNLIGYSAGSRLAFETMYQMALLNRERDGPRLGNVVLISSDLDRSFFAHTLADGLQTSADRLSVYLSGTDSALFMSSLVFGRNRLGQAWGEEDVWPELEARLAELERLEIIDVTDAEEANVGNGHSFFRTSPWASSDIMLALLSDLPVEQRGLTRPEGSSVWSFPADYPARLSDIRDNLDLTPR